MKQFWTDIMEIPEARWIIYGTLLTFAVLIAVYVSMYFRNLAIGGDESEDLDLLSEFRNLRDQGHLEDSEFNRLKTVVPEHAKHELLRGASNGKAEGSERKIYGGRSETEEPQPKKFLTLAEAESLKRAAEDSNEESAGQITDPD